VQQDEPRHRGDGVHHHVVALGKDAVEQPAAVQRTDTERVAVWPDVRSGLVVGAGALYAGLASLARPLSGAALVAVAAPVLIVFVESGRHSPAVPAPRPLLRTAVPWGAMLGLAAVVEVVAFVRQPAYNVASPELPTLSVLLDPLTQAGLTRFLAWCGWLWVGWQLVRR
jgi:hypothetical protein